MAELEPEAPTAFGLDAFGVEARLRLFRFAAREDRLEYLWLLRAVDRGRRRYQVRLAEEEMRSLLDELRAEIPDVPHGIDITAKCDQLTEDGVLGRSHDTSRVATIREYRQRRAIYQFTEAGYLAYGAVERVLTSRVEEADLGRLQLSDLLSDLDALAEANRVGDAIEVVRKLERLDTALKDLAERSARFYLTLGDLMGTHDARPEVFLRYKDALLAHIGDFQADLARYAPLLANAVGAVERSGEEELVHRAAAADTRPLLSERERLEDWRERWRGLVAWFRPPSASGRSRADHLQDAGINAIAHMLALLRQVTEARRGGVTRESQLRHLAAWFAALPADDEAHALFGAAFGLRSARHVAIAHPDPEREPASLSWWEALPVEIARTLREHGVRAGAGRVAPIVRQDAARRLLAERQARLVEERRLAATRLLDGGLYERTLDAAETSLFLHLLGRALAARRPGAGRCVGRDHGLELILVAHSGVWSIVTARGVLSLEGWRPEVHRAVTPGWTVPERRAAGGLRL